MVVGGQAIGVRRDLAVVVVAASVVEVRAALPEGRVGLEAVAAAGPRAGMAARRAAQGSRQAGRAGLGMVTPRAGGGVRGILDRDRALGDRDLVRRKVAVARMCRVAVVARANAGRVRQAASSAVSAERAVGPKVSVLGDPGQATDRRQVADQELRAGLARVRRALSAPRAGAATRTMMLHRVKAARQDVGVTAGSRQTRSQAVVLRGDRIGRGPAGRDSARQAAAGGVTEGRGAIAPRVRGRQPGMVSGPGTAVVPGGLASAGRTVAGTVSGPGTAVARAGAARAGMVSVGRTEAVGTGLAVRVSTPGTTTVSSVPSLASRFLPASPQTSSIRRPARS